MKTPGQIDYEAYKARHAELGLEIEENWEDMGPEDQDAWEAGAQAVLDTQPCVHPKKDVRAFMEDGHYVGFKCHRCNKEIFRLKKPYYFNKCTKCNQEL